MKSLALLMQSYRCMYTFFSYASMIVDRNSASDSINQKLLFVGSEEGKLLALRQTFEKVSA